MRLSDIQIRDPFIVPIPEEGAYYLYGTTDTNAWGGPGSGFDTYVSRDLEAWEGPIPAFRPEPGFWGVENFWAPEMHRYRGRCYLFASFKAPEVCRGTQVLVADGPRGPFRPHSDGPLTPRDWECLDGTLHVDDAGVPWLVFCHEWVQIGNGGMCLLRLSDDLSRPVSAPVDLFHAADAPWAAPVDGGYVTDGPFLHRTADGTLLMLWSSLGAAGYALGVARSTSGHVAGPWVQQSAPLFAADGGHGMLFRTFDGVLTLTLHRPNATPHERAVLLPVVETADGLRLAKAP
jgi:beta-xylosidase